MDFTIELIVAFLLGVLLTHIYWRIRIHLTAMKMISLLEEVKRGDGSVIRPQRLLFAEEHAGQILFHDAETSQFVMQSISMVAAAELYAQLNPEDTAVLVRHGDELLVFNEGTIIDNSTAKFTIER